MDDRTRKLGFAAVGLALFAGFVALTNWTGDDPDSVASLDDQEQDQLRGLCLVLSEVPYDMLLTAAAGGDLMGQGGMVGLGFDQFMSVADEVPDQFEADARHAAEGLQDALDGDLDPGEADEYIASFERLQAETADDCDQIQDIEVEGIGGFEG